MTDIVRADGDLKFVAVCDDGVAVDPLLRAFGLAAALVFPREFKPNCCLNGTRVFLEVMRSFGKKASALSVDCVVANRVMLALLDEHNGEIPEGQGQAWRDKGAHYIQIDTEETHGGGFAGHVIAECDGWLVDSSAKQFHRPLKSIFMPSVLAARKQPEFVEDRGAQSVLTEDGAVVQYWLRSNDERHLSVPGFQRSRNNLRVAGIIERLMRGPLHELSRV